MMFNKIMNMKSIFKKILSLVLIMCISSSLLYNYVSANSNETPADDFTVITNTDEKCTILVEDNGIEVYATMDKITEEVTVKTVEKDSTKLFGNKVEQNFEVEIENLTEDEVKATLVNSDTNEKIMIDENSDKITAQAIALGGGLVTIIAALKIIGIVVGTFVVCGTTYYVASELEKKLVKEYEDAKRKKEKPKVYFAAARGTKGVGVKKALTYNEARNRVKSGGDVVAINRSFALSLVNGCGGYLREEIDKGKENVPGFYYHFHPKCNPKAHVWYFMR